METLLQHIEQAAGIPVVQGLLAALSTFILEDPTTVGCGLLVARGIMGFSTAFVGLFLGIALGDMGLYGLGRWKWTERIGRRLLPESLLSGEGVARARDSFRRNAVLALVLSRFVPGMRLPTYFCAGLTRISFPLFVLVIVPCTLVWTLLLLLATQAMGRAVLDRLGTMHFTFFSVFLVLMIFMGSRLTLGRSRDREPPSFSFFEFWPGWLFYLPLVPWWCWLSLRYRGVLTPTAANPSIYWSGLIMESKSEILRLIPDEKVVADWMLVRAPLESTEMDREMHAILEAMRGQGLSFPLVAKPDRGQRGDGVRPVLSEDELESYVGAFPPGREFLLQRLVPWEGDAGVFYCRMPGAERGTVSSLTLRTKPHLTGDGSRTVRELILADDRARRLKDIYGRRLKDRLENVPAEGEKIPLVFSGNHCQGAVFHNGNGHITRELEDRFDALARSIPGFYFGRFDIRFRSLEELERGEGFRIVELNGASAESTHIWDAGTTLWQAYGALFKQFETLFRIGAANRASGHPVQSALSFLRDVRSYRRMAARYPDTA